jgi:hypothetical protein
MVKFAAAVLMLLFLCVPSVAHAEQGPGYGGDADALAVTWENPKNKAMAAGPPAVPTEQNGGTSDGPLTDPKRLALSPEQSRLNVEGIGFRGLSEVTVQFGDEDPVAVRVDQTGTMTTTFPATGTDAPGTTIVAIGRGPSGAIRTLVGSVPPMPSGTNLMGMVPWLIVVPVVGIAALSLVRRRPAEQADANVAFGKPAPTPA